MLYCDNHLLVVDKPHGLLTQPSGTADPNLQEEAKLWLKQQYQKPGNVFLEPIHRLDRPVAGIVLFARMSKALSRLQRAVRERRFVKIYQATVTKKLPKQCDTIEHHLLHAAYRAQVVLADHPQAKRARLHYRQLEPYLAEIRLETGRYHQIRAQLAAIGCPIVGDTKYGAPATDRPLALTHVTCELPHPISGATLRITKESENPTR